MKRRVMRIPVKPATDSGGSRPPSERSDAGSFYSASSGRFRSIKFTFGTRFIIISFLRLGVRLPAQSLHRQTRSSFV